MSRIYCRIENLSLSFGPNPLFEDFNATLHQGERIGLMGPNGSGKSSLLKIISGDIAPSSGDVKVLPGISVARVPQIVMKPEYASKSGGERFQAALGEALRLRPDILLLDEPTNHLDAYHRKKLQRFMGKYDGVLIFSSHDEALLRDCATSLWVLEGKRVHVVQEGYDAFQVHLKKSHEKSEQTSNILKREKAKNHAQLMKEQERSKKRRLYGEKKYKDDKLALRNAQGRGNQTVAKNRKWLSTAKDTILESLAHFRRPERLKPTFSLAGQPISSNQTLLAVSGGVVGYGKPLLENIHFSLQGRSRFAIKGANGSGKTTLLRAIYDYPCLRLAGEWIVSPSKDIGYLDQHYGGINPQETVLDVLKNVRPDWEGTDIRGHLNDFLFRREEEVSKRVEYLSGGERARLSLAMIAAKTPKLLILDEITNNLDLETKGHVLDVLKLYPGAILMVSHDEEFLERLGITGILECNPQNLSKGN